MRESEEVQVNGVMQAFEDLPDPRKQMGRYQYRLDEMLLTALCAVAAGS